ncbi:hypothetical protein KOI35_36935 [Actinoplanes bogorensis]|uniref:Antirestriction protein ArdA n=1 Tax=Paractinoplanes bogorensis TaxID=1610840 RepID=A0ABS5Z093_9ACTN|nr:hypothetical protein [Actinoplanes bogorensis]MBU2669114.1 hypothetical protein [Actinoplanes bogorensis]
MDLYRADIGDEGMAYEFAETLCSQGYDARANGEWVDLSPETVESMSAEIGEECDGHLSDDRTRIRYQFGTYPVLALY